MKIRIVSVNWPLVVLALCAAVAGPVKIGLAVGAFVGLSLAAPFVVVYGIPWLKARWVGFACKGQPRERLPVVGYPNVCGERADWFFALDTVTKRLLCVPILNDRRRLGFSETGEVLVSTNRFTGTWIVHGLAPPN